MNTSAWDFIWFIAIDYIKSGDSFIDTPSGL